MTDQELTIPFDGIPDEPTGETWERDGFMRHLRGDEKIKHQMRDQPSIPG
jgi:hypothetical protein